MKTGLKMIVLIAGLGLMMTGSLFGQAGSFNAQAWYYVGESTTNVVAADVTGDGKPDLISANNNNSNLELNILVNKGNGIYGTRKIYNFAGKGVDMIAVGDVNGDGKLDVVAAGSSDGKIHVMLNGGAGVFNSITSYDGDGTIFSIILANIDGGTDLEIITGNHQYDPVGNSYSVYFNNGSGDFSSRTDYVTGDYPSTIQAANVDGDTDIDLIFGYEYGTKISVAKNNGNGTFSSLNDFTGGTELYTIKAVNINADSFIDIVASDLGANYPQIFTNNGTGSFTASNGPNFGASQLDILTSDVDADGKQDLIAGTSGISVAKGNGNGTFAASTTYTGIMDPSYWGSTADVDSDGDQDAIFIGTTDNVSKGYVIVALNNQSVPPTVSSHTPTFYALDVSASSNVTVTFSRDMNSATLTNSTIRLVGSLTGKHSGALSYNSGSKTVTIDPTTNFKPGEVVTVMINTGVQTSDGAYLSKAYQYSYTVETATSTGNLSLKTDYSTGSNPYYVATGDLDGDGDLDLATTNYEGASVSILLNTGSGSFSAKTDYTTGSKPSAITLADMDWDGDLDLVITNYWGESVSLLKNNGNGTFAAKTDFSDETSLGHAVADFNGDGYLDVMTQSVDSGIVRFNQGNGTFLAGYEKRETVGDYNIVAGDYNRDGFPDAFYTDQRGSSYNFPYNNGDGTFSNGLIDQLYDLESKGIVLADLNADGWIDVVKVDSYYKKAMVLLSTGNGGFASSTTDYTLGNSPEGITAVDIDGDGDIDLVAVNSGDDNIFVLKNNGNGTFAAKVEYAVGDNPQNIAYGDFDGDGDVDIVVTNKDSNTLSVYKNGTPPPQISSVSPTANDIDIMASSSISITFDQDMSSGTLTTSTILVSSLQKGKIAGSVSYNSGNKTATFDPTSDFLVGDVVTVTVKTGAQSTNNAGISAPYTWSFTVKALVGGPFVSSQNFASGTNPRNMTSGDYDGDGDIDLATANYNGTNFSVLKNNGDGTYAAAVNYAAGTNPFAMTSADIDNDGDLDVMLSNYNSASVSVYKNNGDGTFAAKTDYTTGTRPSILKTGDLDGDGDKDLVVMNYFSNTLSVLMNNSDGTFAAKTDYATELGPYGMEIADFNGDHLLDLVSVNYNNSNFSVFMNNGNGTFAAKVSYTTGTNPVMTSGADLDGDGDIDLAITSFNTSTMSIFKNNGDGTFAAKTDYTAGSAPFTIVSGDVDVDGDLDLFVINNVSATISMFKNNGDATFQAKADLNVVSQAVGLIVADLDGSGSLDLASTNYNANNVTVWLNVKKPTVASSVPAKNGLNVSPSASAVLTFNQAMSSGTFSTTSVRVNGSQSGYHTGSLSYDNSTFAMTYDPSANFYAGEEVTVTVKTSVQSSYNVNMQKPFTMSYIVDADSSGTFASAVSSEAGTQPTAITSADLNGDHYPDLVTANYTGNSLSVFLNNGNGTMAAKTDLAVGAYPWGVHAVDVDGDGDMDLVSANFNNTLSQFKNNGNGTFAAKTDISTGNTPWGVTSSDIDGDGDMDLITGNYYEHTIGVLKNNGNGTYAAIVNYSSGQKPFNMVMADVDNDGDQDIIASCWDSNALTVLKNNGDGTFAAKQEYGVGGKPRGLSAVDLNGDGNVDLVTAYSNPDYNISVLINSGSGAFASAVNYGTAAKPDGLTTADVDGDGDMDVVVACSDANVVYILKNSGTGTFPSGVSKGTGGYPSDVIAADFDRDGSVDLASSNGTGNSISVLMNNSATNTSGGTYSNVAITTPTTLTGNLDVSGTLTVSSQITTGSNTIDLGTTGSLTGETPSNYIVGKIQTARDVSSPQNNIGGLGISIDPQSNNMGNTTILRETGTAIQSGTLKQVWTITPATQPSGPVTVTLTWPSGNDNNVNLADLVVFKSGDGGGTWSIVSAVFNTASDPRTATFSISSFSEFTIGESGTLPVELVAFTFSGNKLNWATATETNNSGWEIEFRQLTMDNGQQKNAEFRKIGFVAGKGTTTEKQYYSFGIKNLTGSKVEFRLKQIDTDGKFTYSNVLTADLTPETFGLLQNYPNPFNPTTVISYQLPVSGHVKLVVVDMLGREVITLVNDEKSAGNYDVKFDGSRMTSGVYFYKITAGDFSQIKKMTLVK